MSQIETESGLDWISNNGIGSMSESSQFVLKRQLLLLKSRDREKKNEEEVHCMVGWIGGEERSRNTEKIKRNRSHNNRRNKLPRKETWDKLHEPFVLAIRI